MPEKKLKKKRIKIMAFALLTVVMLFVSGTGKGSSVFAAGTDKKKDNSVSYQPQIDAAAARKAQLEKMLKDLKDKTEELTNERTELAGHIEALDKQSAELSEQIEELSSEIDTCRLDIMSATEKYLNSKAYADRQYDQMKLRIKYMYENGDDTFFDVLFGSAGISDFLNALEYRMQITAYDNSLYTKYENAKNEAYETGLLLEAKLEELTALEATKEYELESVRTLKAAKSARIIKLANEIGLDEDTIADYWDEIVYQGATIEELTVLEEERLAAEAERLRIEAEYKFNHSLDNILWPVPSSYKITSYFGPRKAPIEGASTYHQGIDIGKSPVGTPIISVLAGEVIHAGYGESAGNYLRISHGNGVVSVYMHCSKLLVDKGDEVERGQLIAYVGDTGVATGPHLHFGLYIDGKAINPLEYLPYKE
ncbi:MAG: peptidoglycan DD-metalloendopeptidase family protein [Lachnospiraceae bacterium]|nr:peptidoglycan DD-metalloendopeptidase family protein [Lachnospiraceae bacterium]